MALLSLKFTISLTLRLRFCRPRPRLGRGLTLPASAQLCHCTAEVDANTVDSLDSKRCVRIDQVTVMVRNHGRGNISTEGCVRKKEKKGTERYTSGDYRCSVSWAGSGSPPAKSVKRALLGGSRGAAIPRQDRRGDADWRHLCPCGCGHVLMGYRDCYCCCSLIVSYNS